MEMTSARALLVEPGDLDASAAVTTTIPRDEIEAALASDEPAELVLDVVRPGSAGEPTSVSVAWERPDLERLLVDARGDAVTFAFSAQELEKALDDPEFEGHGIRERAALLTVAAMAAAGVSAAQATAKPIPVGGAVDGASAPITAVSSHDEATLADRGIVTPAVAHDEAGLAARGIQATAGHDEAGLAARGITSQPAPAVHDELPPAARGIEVTPAHDEAPLSVRGIEGGTVATHDEATLADRGIQPVPVADDSGFTLPTVDPGTAAAVGGAAGGAALLIAAAAFAARRRPPVRPA